MKRAFVLTEGCCLASALVPTDTQSALSIGDRITVTRPLALAYGAHIEEGEQGTVVFIDALTGFTEILMDLYHRGLHDWHNHMWLEPYGTEDIIDAIMLCSVALKLVA